MEPSTEDLIEFARQSLRPSKGRSFMSSGARQDYDEVFTVEDITPLRAMTLIAATWMENETGLVLRPTQLDVIIEYADAMSKGEWEYRPDGDTLDIVNGRVSGGKHRIHAVLLSNTTQKFNVKYRTKKEN